MDVGSFLREAREAAGLSQVELAGRCGVSQGALSAYEHNARLPRLDQITRILAGMGRQLRLESEPLWADVDAAIARAAGKSLAERLADMTVRPLDLADGLGDLPYVIEGLCAAALLGAPVPVTAIDLALLDEEQVLERFTDWARLNARRWCDRWQEFGYTQPHPREAADELRYRSRHGEVRLRLVDRLPDSVAVTIEGRTLRVADTLAVEASDPVAARILDRMRRRIACGP